MNNQGVTLESLVERVQNDPRILPHNIPVSLGLIATTDPTELKTAASDATLNHFDTHNQAKLSNHGARLSLAEYSRLQQAGDPTNPRIILAEEDYIAHASQAMEAELALPAHALTQRVRNEVNQDILRLGRRGRLATLAAGFLAGIGLAFGAAHQTTEADKARETQVQLSETHRNVITTAGSLAGGGLGGLIAAPIAGRLNGRFAQRRARRLVERAAQVS